MELEEKVVEEEQLLVSCSPHIENLQHVVLMALKQLGHSEEVSVIVQLLLLVEIVEISLVKIEPTWRVYMKQRTPRKHILQQTSVYLPNLYEFRKVKIIFNTCG